MPPALGPGLGRQRRRPRHAVGQDQQATRGAIQFAQPRGGGGGVADHAGGAGGDTPLHGGGALAAPCRRRVGEHLVRLVDQGHTQAPAQQQVGQLELADVEQVRGAPIDQVAQARGEETRRMPMRERRQAVQRRRPAARQRQQLDAGDGIDTQRRQRRGAGYRNMGQVKLDAGGGEAGHRVRHLHPARARQGQGFGEGIEQAHGVRPLRLSRPR